MADRMSRLEAAVANIRRIPQPFRPTLTGPTAIRKIFHKQDDALSFAEKFGSEMMVFSYESSSLGYAGQRLFLASGVESFFHYYRQMNPSDRCHYEVIPTYRPAKLYLDLEFSLSANPDRNGTESVGVFLKAVLCALSHLYGVKASLDDVLILDSSTKEKFSQHVVFNSLDTVFESNLEQGQFINQVCRALSFLVSEQSDEVSSSDNTPHCQVCNQVARDMAGKFVVADGITPADAERCLFRTIDGDHSHSICDLGVYTRNRNFRLAGSHKLIGTSVLWPLNKNYSATLEDVWPTWSDWSRTLVTALQCERTSGKTSGCRSLKLLRRPALDCTCSLLSRHPLRGVSGMQSDKEDTRSGIILANDLPLELRDFILTVLFNWYTRDKEDVHLHDKENFEAKVWKIRGHDLRCFGVTIDGLRFCERINRRHRSNHVIIVFDFNHGSYHQKCLDPDCRAANFRSHCWPIPSNLCNMMLSNAELRYFDTNDSFDVLSVTDDDLILGGVMDTIDVDFTEQF